ncbi:MAG: hypothetical protein J0H74_32155 [Chitinophagaceae bacterium]|nr:hypothetical protein [Chitinophagaceae bacterium]
MNPTFDFHAWATATKKEWLSKSIKLERGASPEAIVLAEAATSFSFPTEMRILYQLVDGFNNWDWTEGMISLWPMQRIREEYKLNENPNFVGFADFLINSHTIGFYKDRPGIYKSYDEFNPIADNFIHVIELINRNADDLI